MIKENHHNLVNHWNFSKVLSSQVVFCTEKNVSEPKMSAKISKSIRFSSLSEPGGKQWIKHKKQFRIVGGFDKPFYQRTDYISFRQKIRKLHWPTALALTMGLQCGAVKFTTFCYSERDGGGRPQKLCHCSLQPNVVKLCPHEQVFLVNFFLVKEKLPAWTGKFGQIRLVELAWLKAGLHTFSISDLLTQQWKLLAWTTSEENLPKNEPVSLSQWTSFPCQGKHARVDGA